MSKDWRGPLEKCVRVQSEVSAYLECQVKMVGGAKELVMGNIEGG